MAATQTQDPETAPVPDHRGQAGADGAPADGAPADGAPADGAPADGGHADGEHADGGHGASVDGASADGAPARRQAADRAPTGRAPADRGPGVAASLRPLLIDIGIPVGTYYLLRDAFGLSLWLSLALSSIGPAVRSVAGLVKERKLNLLAVLMLAVNLA